MIRIGLPKGRMACESEAICLALGARMKPGMLRYTADAGGCPVGIHLLKAPDIAWMVKGGVLDLGLTGDEWLLEHGVPGECWCVEARSYVASVCLLMAERDRRSIRLIRSVVTPYPALATALLGDLAPGCEVMTVSGSSEGLVPEAGDACLDLVETGETAACHQLAIRRTFRRVTTHVARSDRAPVAVLAPVGELGQGEDCADFGHAVLAAPYGRLGTLAGVSGECADLADEGGVVSQQDAAFPSGDHLVCLGGERRCCPPGACGLAVGGDAPGLRAVLDQRDAAAGQFGGDPGDAGCGPAAQMGQDHRGGRRGDQRLDLLPA